MKIDFTRLRNAPAYNYPMGKWHPDYYGKSLPSPDRLLVAKTRWKTQRPANEFLHPRRDLARPTDAPARQGFTFVVITYSISRARAAGMPPHSAPRDPWCVFRGGPMSDSVPAAFRQFLVDIPRLYRGHFSGYMPVE